MNRTVRIILAAIILGFGVVVIGAFIHGGGVIDIGKMVREHRQEQRIRVLQQSPTRLLTFEEFCNEHKLKCSIEDTGSTQALTAVKPLIQAKGENSNFMLGWGVSKSNSSENNGNSTYTSTMTGVGPAFSFRWNVAETFHDLDLKER